MHLEDVKIRLTLLPMCFAQRLFHAPVDIVGLNSDTETFKLLLTFAEDVKAVVFLWFEEINTVFRKAWSFLKF